jgi:hypothetical protein
MKLKVNILLVLLFLSFVPTAYAQLDGMDRGNPDLYVRIKPYVWLSNLDTEETLEVGHGRHVVGDFYVPVGDTVLDRGWAFSFEVGKGRWRGIVNLSRSDLARSPDALFYSYPDSSTGRQGSYDLSWFTGEFFAAAQVGPFTSSHGIEIYGGLRYMDQRQEVAIEGVSGESAERTESWVDPVVGARMFAELGKRWWAMFHTDIGGFGIGTDFTWTMGGELGFRLIGPLDITMRYNYQEIEYDHGQDAGRFIWRNGVQQGWFFGLQFKR